MAKTENSEPNDPQQQQQVADRSERIFIRILKGKIVPYHFFKKHWMLVTVTVSMILMSIANKYECQTKITEIQRLERQSRGGKRKLQFADSRKQYDANGRNKTARPDIT